MHQAGCGERLLHQRPTSFPPLILHLTFQGSSTTGSIPGIADLLGRGICGAIKRKALALADLLDIVSEKAHQCRTAQGSPSNSVMAWAHMAPSLGFLLHFHTLYLSWFNPSQQLSTTEPFPPPSGVRRRKGKKKK